MLKIIAKKTVLACVLGANIASITTFAYAGYSSSGRSSYSSSSSKSSSYSSISRSSYSSTPSSSSYSSSSRSAYKSSPPSKTAVYIPVTKATAPPSAPYKQDSIKSTKSNATASNARSSNTSSTPSKTAVYTPVTKATAPKPAPFKQDVPKSTNTPKSKSVSNKPIGQSYSALKQSKSKESSNFLTWVLLAWILSDSNKSNATTSPTKEVVVDCKQWLKDNINKPKDLTNEEYKNIKKYCESVTK